MDLFPGPHSEIKKECNKDGNGPISGGTPESGTTEEIANAIQGRFHKGDVVKPKCIWRFKRYAEEALDEESWAWMPYFFSATAFTDTNQVGPYLTRCPAISTTNFVLSHEAKSVAGQIWLLLHV